MTNVMHFLENARLQVKSFPRNIKLKERLYLLSDLKIIWLSREGGQIGSNLFPILNVFFSINLVGFMEKYPVRKVKKY